MTTRILPRDEYPRLAGTALESVWPTLPCDHAKVLVVESDDGDILGAWVLLSMLHVEGIWIAPSERRRGNVMRRLLSGMKRAVIDAGATAAWTGADTDEVADLIRRLGGRKLPCDSYVLPFVKE